MSTVFNAMKLWIALRGDRAEVLAPSETNLPEPIQANNILRARYINPYNVETELHRSMDYFNPPGGCLAVRIGDGEVPPATTAIIFASNGQGEIHCKIGNSARRIIAEEYV